MFHKNGKPNKKRSEMVDKVVMGAVIGGAIGSVIGATIAPKKGRDTRKEIKHAAKKAIKTSGPIFRKIKKFFIKEKQEAADPLKEIPYELEEKQDH